MLKRENFAIETIYVPVKRRGTLDPKRVEEIRPTDGHVCL